MATIGLLTDRGLLTTLELTGAILNGPDSAVLNWMLTHRSTHLTSAAVAVTNSGTSPLLYPLVAAAGLAVRLRTRRWAPVGTTLAAIIVGVLTRLGLSTLVSDSRPPQADQLVRVHGYSFPSGHAATSALMPSPSRPSRPARWRRTASWGTPGATASPVQPQTLRTTCRSSAFRNNWQNTGSRLIALAAALNALSPGVAAQERPGTSHEPRPMQNIPSPPRDTTSGYSEIVYRRGPWRGPVDPWAGRVSVGPASKDFPAPRL